MESSGVLPVNAGNIFKQTYLHRISKRVTVEYTYRSERHAAIEKAKRNAGQEVEFVAHGTDNES